MALRVKNSKNPMAVIWLNELNEKEMRIRELSGTSDNFKKGL